MKRVLAVVSDIHAGSTVGLCGEDPVELDNGGTYAPSLAQRWLHQCWKDFWERVGLACAPNHWLGVLVNGDAFDGDHHGTAEIISRNPGTQFSVLRDLFRNSVLPLVPDAMIVVRGTESHVGKSASSEEGFARWLQGAGVNVVCEPETGARSWWHFRGDIGPVRLAATHHGRIGQRTWTKHTPPTMLAAQIVLEHAIRGERCPDLAIRSHYHTCSDTHDSYPTRVIQTPAWQLHTGYAHRVVPEVLADIGGLIVTIEDDKPLEVEKVLYRPSVGAIPQVTA